MIREKERGVEGGKERGERNWGLGMMGRAFGGKGGGRVPSRRRRSAFHVEFCEERILETDGYFYLGAG